MDMPKEIFASEVDKNTVYMSGASPVRAYNRYFEHSHLPKLTSYTRTDTIPDHTELLKRSQRTARDLRISCEARGFNCYPQGSINYQMWNDAARLEADIDAALEGK